MKEKLDRVVEKFLSRKFLIVIISVVLFVTIERFDTWALLAIFGMYCGANVITKFAVKK
jgi:hypothetical protein